MPRERIFYVIQCSPVDMSETARQEEQELHLEQFYTMLANGVRIRGNIREIYKENKAAGCSGRAFLIKRTLNLIV